MITTSNKDDTSIVVNSNTRVYHESGQSGMHIMWSLRNLAVSMHLKNGLLRVVNISIWIRPWEGIHGTRKVDKRKFLDQGDGWDEGGTSTNCERLC